MKQAPPIIGPLEFSGLKGKLILIEHDSEDESLILIQRAIHGTCNMVYSPTKDVEIHGFNADFTVVIKQQSIYKTHQVMKSLAKEEKELCSIADFHIIARLDMMDLNLPTRERGAQQAAFLAMIASPQILRDSNLIVTSARNEMKLRERADVFLNLRK